MPTRRIAPCLFAAVPLLTACRDVTVPLNFAAAARNGAAFGGTVDSPRCAQTTALDPADSTQVLIRLACLGPLGTTSGGRSTHTILSGFTLQHGWSVDSIVAAAGHVAGLNAGMRVTRTPVRGTNNPLTTINMFVDPAPAVGPDMDSAIIGGTVRIMITGRNLTNAYRP